MVMRLKKLIVFYNQQLFIRTFVVVISILHKLKPIFKINMYSHVWYAHELNTYYVIPIEFI